MAEVLKNKVKKSLIWSFTDQFVNQFVFILFSIYLARILAPSVFGTVGLVTIFTNFAALFIDMGFGVALIQKKDASKDYYSTVFWFNVAAGSLLYLLFYFCAPLISSFYNQPDLVLIIRVLCIIFIISSLTSVQSNLLVKELNFKKKVIFNWIATFSGYGVAFYLTYLNYGVWAVVWMTLTTAMVNSFLYWVSSSWRPDLVFHWSKIKEMASFGLNVLGDTTINYWSRNYDNFIIGKVLGSTDLGIYARAYSLMMLPLKNITSVFSRVLFPAFSKIQNDIPLIRAQYLKIIKYIAAITFPLMIGVSVASKEFVLLVFGENWAKMIPLLSMLSILSAFQSLVSLNGLLYNSLGKANIAFKVSLWVNLVLIITFTIGVQFGIFGLTLGYLIVGTIIAFPIYATAIKLIDLRLIDVYHQLKRIIAGVVVMAVLMYSVNFLNIDSLLTSFLIKFILGSAVYLCMIFVFEKTLIREMILLVKSFVKKQ
ncbi:MOP flippase family protein [Flavobacterium sp. SM15]|uniref:MOP flippase family protein n=1 Tax=Flavobacterium sp. SM15 TaxID=2908005 RepID=UPI001EDB06A0|nr:MOP flippase family protein [Flavobacterium sp. SM15]MCG2611291.1 MOP flippase family protein [Flavobacterium sp. SM15]